MFCSGTPGIDPVTGKARDGIEAQTEQALRNLAAILEAAGTSMVNLVKTMIFYADVLNFAQLNDVYAQRRVRHVRAGSATCTWARRCGSASGGSGDELARPRAQR